MFAFAIWDGRARRLFLARDRLGKKPLVYRAEPGRMLFASEIKSLLQVPGVPREMDPIALDQYLTYMYVPHPRTMFRGIAKLPPGHYAVYERGCLSVSRYWFPEFNFESSEPVRELRERFEAELSEAVRLRLRSDVPLGAFLSGGIDSTTIVGLMQRHLDRPARTFTIGFPVSEFDESGPARLAAGHLGTEHNEFVVQPDSIGILPQLVWQFDEPFGDSSAIPTYYVSQITRQRVTVALTGDGGDELFCGYPRYGTVQQLGAFERLPKPLRQLITNPLWRRLPAPNREQSLARRLRFRMEILAQRADLRYANWVSTFHPQRRRGLYSTDLATQLDGAEPAEFVAEAFRSGSRRSTGQQAMLADLQTYLPCDLLAKVDIASMAHGLECRCPLLDHRVVELAISIPYAEIVRGSGPKPFLTSAFKDLIPESLRRRKKSGFRIPLGHWFRGELSGLVDQWLLGRESLRRGYFREDAIRQLLAEHRSGRWDHGDRIWTLLFLEVWQRTFIDPAAAPTGPAVNDE
jgi:asparagine synthase (glutamine-hydrolysing)